MAVTTRDAQSRRRRTARLSWSLALIIPLAAGRRMAELLGAPLEEVAGASHFLQEDAGEWIGKRLAAWA